MPAPADYAYNVFINCPFDDEYQPLFDAMVFAIFACGRVARCAKESNDAAEVRIDKIVRLIEQSRFGIHDLSRTQVPDGGMPRFNMPLELGLFLGAERFGNRTQRNKSCLVLDKERFNYQASTSDIAGQDAEAHGNDPDRVIVHIRNWLATAGGADLPGGEEIVRRYHLFRSELPALCEALHLNPEKLIFADYAKQVVVWLRANVATLLQSESEDLEAVDE